MRLTVLGGGGGIPAPGVPCGGYLLQHDGFSVLIDPGYGTAEALLAYCRASELDAVYVSHGHPDHCADLNPLLRLRVLHDETDTVLPIWCPAGAVDAVLRLEPTNTYDDAAVVHEFTPGDRLAIGGLTVATALLAHFVTNAAARFDTDRRSITYTGDGAASDSLVDLAWQTDLLVAEATYVDTVDARYSGRLGDASAAGAAASSASAGRLLLGHVWPGTSAIALRRAAERRYDGPISVARPGTVIAV